MSLWRKKDALDKIEKGALNPSSDLTTLLRRCIALGGRTGSTELREWASLELKGYGADVEIPEYRNYVAPLLLDGTTGRAQVTGQVVSADLLPDEMREALMGDLEFRQPISQLVDLRARATKDPHGAKLAPPGMSYVVPIINSQLNGSSRVERVYWAISPITVSGALDAVRTNLVELVAEMRAGTPKGAELPSGEVADQAVQFVVKGVANRVVVNRVDTARDITTTVGGTTSTGATQAESRSRRLGWWAFGIASTIGAVAAVIALVL